MKFQIFSFILLFLIFVKITVCDKKIVCYYTNWAQYRNGAAKFVPKDINPNLCDTIIYAFAQITNSILTTREWNDDTMIQSILAHKTVNPSLRVLIAVGGWNAGSGIFSNLVSDSQARKKFVSTTVVFLKTKGFDGLDIDWEYPGSRDGSRPADKQLFTVLLSELSDAFKPYGLLLTAAVGVGRSTVDNGYEISKISQYLDWINLMTYDFHGSWEFFAGFNAPLYKSSCESGDQIPLNVHEAVQYWISNGAPRDKLVLGIATYGRSFTLADPKNNLPGSATIGPGKTGKYVTEAGFLSYMEICENMLVNGYSNAWDSEHLVPFAYSNNQWIGFDNVKSVQLKADYILSQNLLGSMFWALDLDDFSGNFCNQNKYPLINAVKNRFNNNSTSSATTKTTTAVTTSESTSTITSTSTIIITETSRSTTQATTISTKVPTISSSASNIVSTTQPKTPNNSKLAITSYSIITTILSKSQVNNTTSENLCYDGDKYYPIRETGCKSFYRCTYSDSPAPKIFNFECPDNLIFSFDLQSCGWTFIVKCQ